MTNPYTGRPNHTFWRRTMAGRPVSDIDPVISVPFTIAEQENVATAGSCFAQHIAKTLVRRGFSYLVTEQPPAEGDALARGYGVFPARFGNIYTARQLLQLFRRAYGMFDPHDVAWRRADGRYIDPFRPNIEPDGFPSAEAVRTELDVHFAAVREMFETCRVFIFTLGLTEAWESRVDGAVFPLAPGVVAESQDGADYAFHNFSVAEVEADMLAFIDRLRKVNPGVKIILTVSPVALMATYEDAHVLVSTTYSKAVLRVVAGTISKQRENVAYFPSYEIITGPQAGRALYEDDLREVRPESVDHVMSIFARHFLGAALNVSASPASEPIRTPPTQRRSFLEQELLEAQGVICEEEELDRA